MLKSADTLPSADQDISRHDGLLTSDKYGQEWMVWIAREAWCHTGCVGSGEQCVCGGSEERGLYEAREGFLVK